MKHIAAVVLAAGASRRFGQPKQLLDWGGKPLVAHTTDVALSADLSPVVVVLGHRANEIGQAVTAASAERVRRGSVRLAMNWGWEQGLSSSVRAGLAAVPPDADAAIFLQSDQPLITPVLLRALISRFAETEAGIVYPAIGGEPRPPVLFARRFFPELATLTGDRGGREIISNHPDQAVAVDLDEPDAVADVDAPGDYDRLRTRAGDARGRPAGPVPVADLTQVRHLIVDMDGVLWHSNTPLPGLHEFFSFLRQKGIGFMLATNNSSLMPQQYSDKLARFGVDIPPERVLTSSQATAAYLSGASPSGSRVYPIGQDGIRSALAEKGFVLTDKEAEYVVVGWDRELTWEKLCTAALLIHGGARFVGTNPDNSYPTEQGPAPGNGAQLAALEATTGVAPTIVGKPEPWLYAEAMRRMGASPETTATVGDRLETDIAGGKRAGVTTILALSGIATRGDLEHSQVQPDLVCDDIRDLVRVWREQLDRHGEGHGSGDDA